VAYFSSSSSSVLDVRIYTVKRKKNKAKLEQGRRLFLFLENIKIKTAVTSAAAAAGV